jgi:hypothetical protein
VVTEKVPLVVDSSVTELLIVARSFGCGRNAYGYMGICHAQGVCCWLLRRHNRTGGANSSKLLPPTTALSCIFGGLSNTVTMMRVGRGLLKGRILGMLWVGGKGEGMQGVTRGSVCLNPVHPASLRGVSGERTQFSGSSGGVAPGICPCCSENVLGRGGSREHFAPETKLPRGEQTHP